MANAVDPSFSDKFTHQIRLSRFFCDVSKPSPGFLAHSRGWPLGLQFWPANAFLPLLQQIDTAERRILQCSEHIGRNARSFQLVCALLCDDCIECLHSFQGLTSTLALVESVLPTLTVRACAMLMST